MTPTIRPASPGEPIDEDKDTAIDEALDVAEGAHNLAAPGGPVCACGAPSGHESGACWDCYSKPPILSPSEICHLRTWCIKPEHPPDEPCLEVPRRTLPPSDFGPEQAKRRRY